MNPIPITDSVDPRLDGYRALQKKQRADPERFVAESEVAVQRLCASRFAVESVLVTPGKVERVSGWVPETCPLYVAERKLIEEVVGYDMHRGCAAVGRRPALDALPDMRGREQLAVVVAEGLADPVNVGALVRNCRAFAVDLLLLDAKGADPLVPRAIRASVGNVFRQPLAVRTDLADCLTELREQTGARILAATVGGGATRLDALDPPERFVLLVGNEGRGLSEGLLAVADEQVTIPIAAEADSLNVAAASAVLLHRLIRIK